MSCVGVRAVLIAGLVAVGCVGICSNAVAAEEPSKEEVARKWHDDYVEAYKDAEASHKMLVIFFYDSKADTFFRRGKVETPELRGDLDRFVVARLPIDTVAKIGDKEIVLREEAVFSELRRRAGVAIIDLTDSKSKHFGNVVSVMPQARLRKGFAKRLGTILRLPVGSLTQRTLIFAVRTHPENPASTRGEFHSTLASHTQSHSEHQANIQVQGHHNWDSRFHQINRQMPSDLAAFEVCAESWPGEGLVEAAIDCVDSWRQSSGHWANVRQQSKFYGYDMKRGANGIWYATGIFAR